MLGFDEQGKIKLEDGGEKFIFEEEIFRYSQPIKFFGFFDWLTISGTTKNDRKI